MSTKRRGTRNYVFHLNQNGSLTPQERSVDSNIRCGEFKEARHKLEVAAHKARSISRLAQASLRLATLPFSELLYSQKVGAPISPTIISDAECVHADIGNILEHLLEVSPLTKGRETSDIAGSLAEATVLALGARRYNRDQSSIIIPTSDYNDRVSEQYAVDIEVIRLEAPTRPTYVQVKAGNTSKWYADNVHVVAVNALGGNRDLLQEDGLPSLVVKELNSTATTEQQAIIEAAEGRLHVQIFGSSVLQRLAMRP